MNIIRKYWKALNAQISVQNSANETDAREKEQPDEETVPRLSDEKQSEEAKGKTEMKKEEKIEVTDTNNLRKSETSPDVTIEKKETKRQNRKERKEKAMTEPTRPRSDRILINKLKTDPTL